MNADLHCHTNQSDGTLSPTEVVKLASARQVDILSITDHDTVKAYQRITEIPTNLRLITGIEFSCQWRKQDIHIVGLDFDIDNSDLVSAIARQTQLRQVRAEKIGHRLAKAGFSYCFEAVQALTENQIGRPHFAQHLINIGAVKNFSEAFRKYLGPGKIGDIKEHWPDIGSAISVIAEAGGIPVLAHPAKYKLTQSKLKCLIGDFCKLGGEAMEVISGHQTKEVSEKLAGLSNKFGLQASCGSDFHTPGKSWADLGKTPSLPDECNPVWSRWA